MEKFTVINNEKTAMRTRSSSISIPTANCPASAKPAKRTRRVNSLDGPPPAKKVCRVDSLDSPKPANPTRRVNSSDGPAPTKPAKSTRRVNSLCGPAPAKKVCRADSGDASKPAKRTRRVNSVDERMPLNQSHQIDDVPNQTRSIVNHDLEKVLQMNMKMSNELYNLKKDLKQTAAKSSFALKQLKIKSLQCIELDKEIAQHEFAIKKMEEERFTDSLIDLSSNGKFFGDNAHLNNITMNKLIFFSILDVKNPEGEVYIRSMEDLKGIVL